MSKKNNQKHCTDELLLQFLDGELGFRVDRRVKKHLHVCWACRGRLVELERNAEKIAALLNTPSFPSPKRVLEAKQEFVRWERGDRAAGLFLFRPRPIAASIPLRAFAAACAILLLFGVAAWRFARSDEPEASEMLARVESFETRLYGSSLPVHQVLRIEAIESGPAERRRTSRVEIWSDRVGRRFAVRWKDEQGALRDAMWRPEENRRYRYDPARRRAVADTGDVRRSTGSLADLARYGLDLERLEASLIDRIQHETWRPVAFAADVSTFLGSGGALLKAERVRLDNGERRLRISAERVIDGVRTRVVLEANPEDYRPYLHSITFEVGGRTLELRMVVERAEIVPRAVMTANVFEPEAPIAPAVRAAASRRPGNSEPAPAPVRWAPTEMERAAAEIEARYILHRARACLGEPVEIVRESGGILVRGIAQTLQRKEELLNSLAELQAVDLVTVDIRTVDEIVSAQSSPAEQAPGSPKSSLPHEIRPGETMRFSSGRLPIQDQLERFISEHRALGEDSAGLQRRVTEFSNKAVSLSEAVLDEAWALRRLAERYGPAITEVLRAQSRWLLEAMARDHVMAVQEKSSVLGSLLGPMLTSIVGEDQLPARGSRVAPPLGAPATTSLPNSVWSESSLVLFETVEQIQGLVHGLLAGAGLPVEVDTAAGPAAPLRVRVKRPEEAVADLLAAFPWLESGFPSLEALLDREFRPQPDLQTLNH